jgi:hypothetical protein
VFSAEDGVLYKMEALSGVDGDCFTRLRDIGVGCSAGACEIPRSGLGWDISGCSPAAGGWDIVARSLAL